MRRIWIFLFGLILTACQPAQEPDKDESPESRVAVAETDRSPDPAPEPEPVEPSSSERLTQILAGRPAEIQARYDQRHPRETLEFFGIEPGMTVVEALPSSGWYSKILLPYLGREGHLIGANYPITLFQQFDFVTPEYLERIANWPETFPVEAADWCEDDCASISGFWLGQLPDSMAGTADAVLFVRALHNMARFQNAGVDSFLDQALTSAYDVLAPGGILGIVQHEAREDMPDEWATGGTGYVKRSFVIAQAEAAGFALEEASDINANPADQPTESDVVWRLPPSLRGSNDDPGSMAAMEAVGESNRMTLRFRKPIDN